jgi:hypothetical protein
MVRALLINYVEFVEEVCRLRKKERTYSSMHFVKSEISVLRLFNESRYKTMFCFGQIATTIQWLSLR